LRRKKKERRTVLHEEKDAIMVFSVSFVQSSRVCEFNLLSLSLSLSLSLYLVVFFMCSITFDVEVSMAGQQWQRESTGTRAPPVMCMPIFP